MPASPCLDCRAELAAYRGRCPDCARRYNAQTHRTGRLEPTGGRMYGKRRWLMLRRRRLAIEPMCRACAAQGIDELASEVDHLTPVEQGGDPWALEGTQSLCASCHARKTRREQRQGITPAA